MSKVLIIANSRYPEGTANSINVFRMSTAFASEGFNVRLIALRSSLFISKQYLWEDTCRRYGDNPDIKGTFFWWPFRRAAEPVLAILIFFILLISKRNTLIYTRIGYVALLAVTMGFYTAFESHAPPKNTLLRKIESRLLRHSKALVVLITEGLRKTYRAINLPADNAIVVPDAGRLLRHAIPHKREFNGPCLDVGYIGSLYKGRGFEIIVSIAEKMPERRFHIIGDLATLSTHLKKYPENIIRYGALTPDQAERIAGLFDAFLMPYQQEVRIGNDLDTSSWMSPMKMFEYMLSGTPIVSSNLTVLREILNDSENAILVEPADVEGWVSALYRLDSPELRYRLARKAFEEASANYTWDIRLKRILKSLKP
jgi:glycosyltransferase involved in cell wall biosynthesis